MTQPEPLRALNRRCYLVSQVLRLCCSNATGAKTLPCTRWLCVPVGEARRGEVRRGAARRIDSDRITTRFYAPEGRVLLPRWCHSGSGQCLLALSALTDSIRLLDSSCCVFLAAHILFSCFYASCESFQPCFCVCTKVDPMNNTCCVSHRLRLKVQV